MVLSPFFFLLKGKMTLGFKKKQTIETGTICPKGTLELTVN